MNKLSSKKFVLISSITANKIEKLLADDLENFGVRTENGVSSLNDKLHNIKERVIETDNNLIK